MQNIVREYHEIEFNYKNLNFEKCVKTGIKNEKKSLKIIENWENIS